MTELNDQHNETGGEHVCAGCFANFGWKPTESGGEKYCCPGCAGGGPCVCTYAGPVADAETGGAEPPQRPETATTPPAGGDAGTDGPAHPPSGDDESHVCANCFAEFSWAPTVVAGESFCCPGCAGGGPCICSYAGPVEAAAAGAPAEDARQSASSGGPAHRGRADVILAALNELPTELKEVSTLRVTRDVPVESIAAELGVSPEIAKTRLAKAQMLIDRALGPGYPVEYAPTIAAPPSAPAAAGVAVAPERPAATLGELIQSSVPALEQIAAGGRVPETADTVREALNDASEIFRLAARRLTEPAPERRDLRSMLADEGSGGFTLVVTGLGDAARYSLALQDIDQVENVGIEGIENGEATFKVAAGSQRSLLAGLMAMTGGYRPSRLRVSGERIEIEVRESAPKEERKAAATFELGADAFFGARHYLTFGGNRGETHYHSWRVEVLLESGGPDEQGVVVGFAEARGALEATVTRYNETLLNDIPPFDTVQPTAENLAREIFREVKPQIESGTTRLRQVRVWESPTNHASYSEA